jgi:hypothetical protein
MSAFDVFYAVYPRKQGRRVAEVAFERSVKRGNDPQELIKAATKFRDDPDRQRDGIKLTPLPATWLNQDRHLDDRSQFVVPEPVFLFDADDPDDRPACCREAPDYGFGHWLEVHATPEEVEKAHRFGVAKRLGVSA